MPTVLALDVSLSMSRIVGTSKLNKDGEVAGKGAEESMEIRRLANIGLGCILDYLAQKAQLEYTALVVFSSLWEIEHEFTKNHEKIKDKIYDLEIYDKSNIVSALRGILQLKLNEWSQSGPVNIILVTDGQIYKETESKTFHEDDSDSKRNEAHVNFCDLDPEDLDGSFDFPCKLQIVCLASPRDPILKHSLPIYKQLISVVDKSTTVSDCPVIIGPNHRGCKQSAIWLPESENLDIPLKSVEDTFSSLVDLHYCPYHTTLSCGNLASLVMLSPGPTDCLLEPLNNEFDDLKREKSSTKPGGSRETFVSALNKSKLFKLNEEINIIGFMPISEIATPAVISRHLILPIPDSKFDESLKAMQILSQDLSSHNKSTSLTAIEDQSPIPSVKSRHPTKKLKTIGETPTKNGRMAIENPIEIDITKQPSFSVLLHNGLKSENMVAICIIGRSEETSDEWFGMIHSHTDSKKHSSLMLSLLIPGPTPVSWLPNFRTMGSAELNSDLPPTIRDKISQNKKNAVKSYSSNSVIWLDPESVQTDVHKILRLAKRSPERSAHFYKELNRIRKAAISYGFFDVLHGLAAILERERNIVLTDQAKGSSHEFWIQMEHVIASLRGKLMDNSYNTVIGPLDQ